MLVRKEGKKRRGGQEGGHEGRVEGRDNYDLGLKKGKQ